MTDVMDRPSVKTYKQSIGGKAVDSASGETLDIENPANGQVIAKVPASAAEDVDRAVDAARKAFDDRKGWANWAAGKRGRSLAKLADLIKKNSEELAWLESRNVGKPIGGARGEIIGASLVFDYYAGAANKIYGQTIPVSKPGLDLTLREPIGVVGLIVPWNFPLLMASWKLAPALAVGNSVVLKPAEQSPLTALRLGALAAEAGLPDGVLQVVPGDGPGAGQPLGLHPDVDMIAFTGSTEIGKRFLRYAGESNMKRISLECGGKSPHIVLPDCHDLPAAASAAAWGVFYNQGEVCNAGTRLVVHEQIKDEFMDLLLAAARDIAPGNPLDPDTTLGAMVDQTQTERVMGYIETGRTEGADLILGGSRVRTDTGGFYIEPTVFDRVRNDMTLAREEIFGPVLSTIEVGSEAEAVTVANDTMYGLAAAVWTDSVDAAHRVARAIRAGVVWVNTFDAGDITSPFGGFKQSGFGRDKSIHALEKYADLKTVWIGLRS